MKSIDEMTDEEIAAELASYDRPDEFTVLSADEYSREEEVDQNDSFLGDTESLFSAGLAQGTADLLGGLGWDSADEYFTEAAENQRKELTAETQDAMSNFGIIDDDKEFSAKGLAAVVLESMGQMGTFIVPGTMAGKVVAMGSRAFTGLNKAKQALTLAKASKNTAAVKKLEKAIAKADKGIGRIASPAGYSVVGGAQGYEQGADEAEQLIRATNNQELLDSDEYIQQLYGAHLKQDKPASEAWAAAVEDYIAQKRFEVGGKNSLIMAITSGALAGQFDKIGKSFTSAAGPNSLAKGARTGAITETTQESAQEAGAVYAIKDSLQNLKAAQDINMADRVAVGAVAGGVAGGAVGGAGGAIESNRNKKQMKAMQDINAKILAGEEADTAELEASRFGFDKVNKTKPNTQPVTEDWIDALFKDIDNGKTPDLASVVSTDKTVQEQIDETPIEEGYDTTRGEASISTKSSVENIDSPYDAATSEVGTKDKEVERLIAELADMKGTPITRDGVVRGMSTGAQLAVSQKKARIEEIKASKLELETAEAELKKVADKDGGAGNLSIFNTEPNIEENKARLKVMKATKKLETARTAELQATAAIEAKAIELNGAKEDQRIAKQQMDEVATAEVEVTPMDKTKGGTKTEKAARKINADKQKAVEDEIKAKEKEAADAEKKANKERAALETEAIKLDKAYESAKTRAAKKAIREEKAANHKAQMKVNADARAEKKAFNQSVKESKAALKKLEKEWANTTERKRKANEPTEVADDNDSVAETNEVVEKQEVKPRVIKPPTAEEARIVAEMKAADLEQQKLDDANYAAYDKAKAEKKKAKAKETDAKLEAELKKEAEPVEEVSLADMNPKQVRNKAKSLGIETYDDENSRNRNVRTLRKEILAAEEAEAEPKPDAYIEMWLKDDISTILGPESLERYNSNPDLKKAVDDAVRGIKGVPERDTALVKAFKGFKPKKKARKKTVQEDASPEGLTLRDIDSGFEDDNGSPMNMREAYDEIVDRLSKVDQMRGCI